eukprot:CAMPEP_0171682666 /NCGR_PEP_ID=MMETSP0991-20121206/665_1 /TAXON_ID=483369 /ORGANISM="non described non described, Strain CCMP2098" /LENGTH=224 /DNA_ID=CAMNT_0012269919 /DNA_START=142 /DNA_END=816 /DNA_ORIENTATION=-
MRIPSIAGTFLRVHAVHSCHRGPRPPSAGKTPFEDEPEHNLGTEAALVTSLASALTSSHLTPTNQQLEVLKATKKDQDSNDVVQTDTQMTLPGYFKKTPTSCMETKSEDRAQDIQAAPSVFSASWFTDKEISRQIFLTAVGTLVANVLITVSIQIWIFFMKYKSEDETRHLDYFIKLNDIITTKEARLKKLRDPAKKQAEEASLKKLEKKMEMAELALNQLYSK